MYFKLHDRKAGCRGESGRTIGWLLRACGIAWGCDWRRLASNGGGGSAVEDMEIWKAVQSEEDEWKRE